MSKRALYSQFTGWTAGSKLYVDRSIKNNKGVWLRIYGGDMGGNSSIWLDSAATAELGRLIRAISRPSRAKRVR